MGSAIEELQRLRTSFQQPSKAFSPVPLWWWSGGRLDPARLRWELEQFVAGGVFNLVVMNLAPSGPLYGADADDPPFFSEAWWTIFRGVCADARALGVRLWFYDQIGFSGANIQGGIIHEHPSYAGLTLERLILAPSELTSLPSDAAVVQCAVCPLDGEGAPAGDAIILPDVSAYTPDGYAGPHRLRVIYAVPRGFDYLNPEACAALIDRIHGEYERRVGEYFGDVIVGSFEDELPALPAWSRDFAGVFHRRHGYDPRPLLHHLWDDDGSADGTADGRRLRHDYQRTRAELAERAFFRPLFDWHHQRGLICGFDQQGGARAGEPVAATRLYADYLRTHRWYGAPGSDHHGDAKIHSSLAHLYGRPRVWIESFHSSGWGGTLEETYDWLLPWIQAGANLYNPHASYYSTHAGWFEWAPPSTDWRQPYWRHYPIFARAVARLCQTLSQGDHACDVGVLFPTTTVQAGTGIGLTTGAAALAQETYLRLTGRMAWYDVAAGELNRLAIDFDVLDDDSIAGGTVIDGALAVGAERYRVILLPACTLLDGATARALAAFAANGGRLIAIGTLPEGTLGDDGDARDALRRIATKAALVQIEDLGPALDHAPLRVRADVPTLVRVAGEATLVFVPATFPRASEVSGSWKRVEIRFDPAAYARSRVVRVRGVTGRPELWEPVSGAMRPVTQWAPWEDGVEATVTFDDGPGAILIWPGKEPSEDDAAPEHTDEVVVRSLDGPWTVTLEDTLCNRWGDFALPASPTVLYARWSLLVRSEGPDEDGIRSGWTDPRTDAALWRPGVATFGPHANWAGPGEGRALMRLPEPEHSLSDHWREVEYSTSRGIHKDPLHGGEPLGPSGHVPEEFLHFGPVKTGESIRLRTHLITPRALETTLALGGAARKRIWVNGTELLVADEGYLSLIAAPLRAGPNGVDILLTAVDDGPLRAYLCAVRDPVAFARPEVISTADGSSRDSSLRFSGHFHVTGRILRGTIQVASSLPCRVLMNGEERGRQGGYMPYGDSSATHPYDVTSALVPGRNEIVCELQDVGRPATLLVDGIVVTDRGETHVITDDAWRVSRDGAVVSLRLERRPKGDPARAFLRQRPHPLPESAWLEGPGADDGTVAPFVLARATSGRVDWLRFDLPPGATAMTLPVRGRTRVFIDGVEVEPVPGEDRVFPTPDPEQPRRVCAVRVETEPGYEGGAALTGPVVFALGEGRMFAGDWQQNGLADFSGAVRYRQAIDLEVIPGRRLTLDLGRVRGTAEVWVNHEPVGARFLSPYRFDVTGHVRTGPNEIEVLVTNTLAPYLDAISPTPFVPAGQTDSGLFGPVHILEREVASW